MGEVQQHDVTHLIIRPGFRYLSVKWDEGGALVHYAYHIQVANDPKFLSIMRDTYSFTPFMTFANLIKGTIYYVRVKNIDRPYCDEDQFPWSYTVSCVVQ